MCELLVLKIPPPSLLWERICSVSAKPPFCLCLLLAFTFHFTLQSKDTVYINSFIVFSTPSSLNTLASYLALIVLSLLYWVKLWERFFLKLPKQDQLSGPCYRFEICWSYRRDNGKSSYLPEQGFGYTCGVGSVIIKVFIMNNT
jgi:hypothetical protein